MNGTTYQDVVTQIKARLDIVDVISKYVILKKSGGNYWGRCPFHNEKTPSFSVSPAKQIYKCFGCGEGGDVLSFLMKINNQSFHETVKEQAELLGIELPSSFEKTDNNKDLKDRIYSCMKDSAEFFKNLLLKDKNSVAYKYLSGRGISDEDIETYKLGFAPNAYDELQKHLKNKYSEDILDKAGLVIKRENGKSPNNMYLDRFRNRITIPIFDDKGNIVAFGARAIEEGQNPKYLNSPDTPVYNKSHILYGLYQAKEAVKEKDAIVIMEGYFDVISAQVNGVKNAVGACGTALTESHVKLISRYTQSRRIYLAFDTDKAGQNATKRGADVIKEAFAGLGNIKQFDESYTSIASNNDRYSCELRVVVPPEGKDPDEFIRENGAAAYQEVLDKAPLLVDFQINSVLKQKRPDMSPIEKSNLVKEVLPFLKEINNDIIRDEYAKVVCAQLNIDENSLKRELKKGLNDTFAAPVKQQKVIAPIVKKSLSISEKAQKNLLSMYLIEESSYSIQTLNSILKDVEYTNNTLIIVKDTIDKLSQRVNNVKELIETLYTEFAEDYEVKDIITDLIYLSDSFKNLSEKDFKNAINENIAKIAAFKEKEAQSHLRTQYKKLNDDEIEAIQIQMQLRENIKNKLRTGDN